MPYPTYDPSTDMLEEYFVTAFQIPSTGQWNQSKYLWNLQSNVVQQFRRHTVNAPTSFRLPLIEILPQITQNIELVDAENIRLICHLLVDSLPSETLNEIIQVVADHMVNKSYSTDTLSEPTSGTEGSIDASQKRLFELAEQFEQERYHLTSDEEASFLDEEYLEWLENN